MGAHVGCELNRTSNHVMCLIAVCVCVCVLCVCVCVRVYYALSLCACACVYQMCLGVSSMLRQQTCIMYIKYDIYAIHNVHREHVKWIPTAYAN